MRRSSCKFNATPSKGGVGWGEGKGVLEDQVLGLQSDSQTRESSSEARESCNQPRWEGASLVGGIIRKPLRLQNKEVRLEYRASRTGIRYPGQRVRLAMQARESDCLKTEI